MPLQRKDDQQGASLLRTYLFAALLVNFLLWGIAVAIFNTGNGLAIAHPGRRPNRIVFLVSSIVVFFMSAVTTLPQVGAVVAYIWTNHKWYLFVVFAVNGLLALFMVWMKKVEQDLNSGRVFGNHKR